MHRFLQNRKHLLEPLGLDGTVILNQYQRDPALFLKKDICNMLHLDVLHEVPFVDGGWQAEMERKNLLSFPKICKAIDKMTGDFEDGTKKVKKWKKLFN